jgi:putative acetyltransferase
VLIREATDADVDAVRAVVAAAFTDDGAVADLVDDLRRAGRVVVELVAEADGEVVGHVALDRCWIDHDEALVEALVLSPLSVVPSRQGSGLGTRLVAAALAAAPDTGADYVFLEGGPAYYGERGFEPALARGFLRPTERIPGPAFQVAVLRDRGVRGRVVYPDAFWSHDATGLRGDVLTEVRRRLGE